MKHFIQNHARSHSCQLTLVVLAILTTALLTACDDNKGGGSCDCKKAQGVVALSSKDYCRNLSNDKGQPISFISTLPQTPTDKVMTEYHSGLNCEGPVIAVE